MPAEMHCHTVFSVDGFRTPEELVDAAVGQGVTALAVTDHNQIGALPRVRERARRHGLRWIPGVEIDARFRGHKVHLLAFGFDLENRDLNNVLQRNYTRYQRQYEMLASHLPAPFRRPSDAELATVLAERYPTHPDPVPNSWVLKFLLQQQATALPATPEPPDLRSLVGAIEAERGPNGYDQLQPFETVCAAVHAAGGVLLLAHVAQVLRGQPAEQIALVEAALDDGADGFELWHPHNLAEPHFKQLEAAAQRLGCLVSGGSDCHDALNATGMKALGSASVPDSAMDAIERRLQAK